VNKKLVNELNKDESNENLRKNTLDSNIAELHHSLAADKFFEDLKKLQGSEVEEISPADTRNGPFGFKQRRTIHVVVTQNTPNESPDHSPTF